MNKYEITWDEQYHLIKLYDLLRDTGMIDDLPKEIETFFEAYQFIKLYDILRDMDMPLTPKQMSVFEKVQEAQLHTTYQGA